MRIRVLQGEREMARDNWTLGEFEVDFEKGPKGSARVGVQFEIDADGILKVLARDTKTGQDKVVEIRHAAVDVTEAKVEEMIAQSVDHAFADMTERQLAEASLKSRELLEAVAGALPQAGDALDAVAREHIAAGVAEVEAALTAGELRRLKAADAALWMRPPKRWPRCSWSGPWRRRWCGGWEVRDGLPPGRGLAPGRPSIVS